MELGQQQIREAADYIKVIFDNMVIDLRAQQVKDKAQFDENVDSFVTELKTQVDAQSKENINKFEEWYSEKYNTVLDATDMTYEEVEDLFVVEETQPE